MAKRGKAVTKKTTSKKAKVKRGCSSTSVTEASVESTTGASSTVEEKEETLDDVLVPALGTTENILIDAVTDPANLDSHLPLVENTDLSDNIIQNEDVSNPDNPGEEFVFAPLISESEQQTVCTVNLITPSTSRHSSTTTIRESATSAHSNSEDAAKIKDSQGSNNTGECSNTLLIEVIDVDDIPDTLTPPSSIGDDVIEITPDNSVRGESPEIVLDRQVVDLTGTADTEGNNNDDELSDREEIDSLLSIWSRMSKRRKSTSTSSTDKLCEEEDKSEADKSDSPSHTKLNCPICMDDFSAIVKDNRQLMSTNCGHVFCSTCLKAAVKTQKKCPTCRKTQTSKNLHPIFL